MDIDGQLRFLTYRMLDDSPIVLHALLGGDDNRRLDDGLVRKGVEE